MKKYFCLFLSLIMTLTLFSSCNKEEDTGEKEDKGSSVSESEKDESTSTEPTSTPEEVKKDTVTAWLITKVDYGSSYTEYVYDDKGQPIKEIHTYTYEGEEHSDEYLYNYEFDDNGFIISEQSDPGGYFIETYNDYGDLIKFDRYIYNEDGTKHPSIPDYYEYKYDENGRMIEKKVDDFEQYTSTYTYNIDGNLLTERIVYDDGTVKTAQCTYDTNGRLIFETDIWNNEYEYKYDDYGRMIKGKLTYANNHTFYAENIIYDEEGNFTATDSYGTTERFDKHGNKLTYNGYYALTYTPIEVTPARKKAIEEQKWDIFYGLQR